MAVSLVNHYAQPVVRTGMTCEYYFYCDWTGNFDEFNLDQKAFFSAYFSWGWNVNHTSVSGSFYTTLAGNPTGIPVDVNMSWYPSIRVVGQGFVTGSVVVTKTLSVPATASAPSVGSITANSASVQCNYVPNVTVSVATAQLQYKRTIDSEWINFAAPKSDAGGYVTATIGAHTLTGLLSSTSYDVRVLITRTTIDNPTVSGAATSFVTAPGEAEVTTTAASSVTANTAQLNATVVINAGTSVQVFWKWGTDNPPTQNTTASQAVPTDGAYSVGITGLVGSQTYFFQPFVTFDTPAGSPNEGLVLSFMTPADPALEAAEEAHMHIYEYDGKYGQAAAFLFTLSAPASSSSDRLVTTVPGTLFAAGDIKISKDGGAFANATNTPTQVAASNPLYSLSLTAAEMQGDQIIVQIVDQDGPAFRDAVIYVRTKLKIGQIDADASQLTNASGMVLTGQGTGHGLEAIGGATGFDFKGIISEHFQRVSVCQANVDGTKAKLDAGASATNDYYNGSVLTCVDGVGAGQSRVIIDYDGTTKEATLDSSMATILTTGSVVLISGGDRTWDLSPAAELAAVPGSTASYGSKMQFLFQRFAFKITQTATLQTWFKANSSTTLASRSVDDDGVTQTLAKLT